MKATSFAPNSSKTSMRSSSFMGGASVQQTTGVPLRKRTIATRGRSLVPRVQAIISRPLEQNEFDQRPMLRSRWCSGVAAVVLGGGESDSRRMFPLTEKRTLPAIPVAGIYRLIDIPMSNLIHSGVNKVFILTQYNSTSLNRYLTRTYDFQGGGIPFGGDGFMEVVAATQDPNSQRWAEGPADSVRQWMQLYNNNAQNRFCDDVLVLPSDQVYRFDFAKLVEAHRNSFADLTIVCRPVDERKAEQFGIVKVNRGSQITDFMEKPTGDDKVAMSMDWDDMKDFMNEGAQIGEGEGSPSVDAAAKALAAAAAASKRDSKKKSGRGYIASCGMYVFRREVLARLLLDEKGKSGKRVRDFGKELIPQMINEGYKVMAYNMPGFWDDIGGSIGDYYNFQMAMVGPDPPLSLESFDAPFFASPHNLPPSETTNCVMKNAMVGPGCRIADSTITNSIVGLMSIIGKGCNISDSVLCGADYYEHEKKFERKISKSFPNMGVGENTTIHKAIVDKNARIGNNCQLVNKEGIEESFDRLKSGLCIRDGVIIVSKSAVIPDGTVF